MGKMSPHRKVWGHFVYSVLQSTEANQSITQNRNADRSSRREVLQCVIPQLVGGTCYPKEAMGLEIDMDFFEGCSFVDNDNGDYLVRGIVKIQEWRHISPFCLMTMPSNNNAKFSRDISDEL